MPQVNDADDYAGLAAAKVYTVVSRQHTHEILIDDANAAWAIHCLRCGKISYKTQDIAMKYCGTCHEFHGGALHAGA